MNNNVKFFGIAGIIIIMVLLFPSCKTVSKVEDTNQLTQIPDEHSFSAIFCTHDALQNINNQFSEAPDNKNVKYFIVFDLTDPGLQMSTRPEPEAKTILKQRIKKLVETDNTDGVGIILSGQSDEIIEQTVSEALLLKPYLLIAIIYGNPDIQVAQNMLNLGIADIIINKDDIKISKTSGSTDKIAVSGYPKRIKPEDVCGLNLSEIFSGQPGGQSVSISGRTRSLTTDSEGCLSFVIQKPDTLELKTQTGSFLLSTRNWFTPYKYSVTADGKAERKSPWVEFRRIPRETSGTSEFDLLCKTDYPSDVTINGISVKQYKTGIFFNKIILKEGTNRIRASVILPDSLSTFYEREFVYSGIDRTSPPLTLWINEKSIEPSDKMEMLSSDILRISFQGSRGQDGYINLTPGKTKVKCSREDFDDYSIYRADMYLNKLSPGKSYRITAAISTSQNSQRIQLMSQGELLIKDIAEFPLVRVKNEYSRLTYNLGAPRLGGPIRSELGPGVIFKTNGRIGDYYKVRLNSTENGFIHKDDIEVLTEGSVRPAYYITSMSCGPSVNADILSVPYPEPVPYEVYPDPILNRIVITLFGVGSASTWITHMAGRKVIDRITWQQSDPETYRISVNLRTGNIWGYDIHQDGKRLLFRVKYPPVYDLNNGKPLSGLKIAIEAGHGGSGLGAVGLSGLLEKDVNLDLSFRLGELCKTMGAEVIQVRDSDKDIPLLEKRDIAVDANADILISIHANAGGRGYLSVAGTSTYWHNPFWAPLAEDIYSRMLELDLKEFGVVGSFNYTVTRASQMPSVLVEQAFMSHAEDEEKLADPLFRQEMAQKIYEGIVDYLKYMNN